MRHYMLKNARMVTEITSMREIRHKLIQEPIVPL